MSVYAKRGILYVSNKRADGRWRGTSTKLSDTPGNRKLLERQVKDGLAKDALLKSMGADEAPLLVEQWYGRWIEQRKSTTRSWRDDEARIRDHFLDRGFRGRDLATIRPRDVRAWLVQLRGTELAPRTIRNVFGAVQAMFRDAAFDELIEQSPCVLPRGVLPPVADADPEWRRTAVLTREEVETIVSSPVILPDRRVLYALKALTASRHGEVAGLRWRHYDPDARPLGCLTVAGSYLRRTTKTGVTRAVPVHPTLAAILAEWKLAGWQELYGRQPEPDDLIVPTRRGTVRTKEDAQHAFLADLAKLGMRRRRGHDFRRTFITLARVDGAREDLLKVVTHGASARIMDIYTTYPWEALCAEVAKLRISRKIGEVMRLEAV